MSFKKGYKIKRDCSIIVVKPDMIERGLVKELEYRLREEGLKIIECREILMDLEFVKALYQWPALLHPAELNAYLCKSPLPIWLLKGKNAVEVILKIKRQMRKTYCTNQLHTLFHCPDTPEDFEREYKLIYLNEGG